MDERDVEQLVYSRCLHGDLEGKEDLQVVRPLKKAIHIKRWKMSRRLAREETDRDIPGLGATHWLPPKEEVLFNPFEPATSPIPRGANSKDLVLHYTRARSKFGSWSSKKKNRLAVMLSHELGHIMNRVGKIRPEIKEGWPWAGTAGEMREETLAWVWALKKYKGERKEVMPVVYDSLGWYWSRLPPKERKKWKRYLRYVRHLKRKGSLKKVIHIKRWEPSSKLRMLSRLKDEQSKASVEAFDAAIIESYPYLDNPFESGRIELPENVFPKDFVLSYTRIKDRFADMTEKEKNRMAILFGHELGHIMGGKKRGAFARRRPGYGTARQMRDEALSWVWALKRYKGDRKDVMSRVYSSLSTYHSMLDPKERKKWERYVRRVRKLRQRGGRMKKSERQPVPSGVGFYHWAKPKTVVSMAKDLFRLGRGSKRERRQRCATHLKTLARLVSYKSLKWPDEIKERLAANFTKMAEVLERKRKK